MTAFPALLAAAALAQGAAPAPPPAELAGRWVIEKAVIAPWADAKLWADRTEEKRLLGKTVVFGAEAVTAPQPLGCAAPTYRRYEAPPEGLFEGGLAGTDANGPVRAAARARDLGMTTPTVPTWETGCSEMLFHGFGPDAILFALDNRIYTLRRRR